MSTDNDIVDVPDGESEDLIPSEDQPGFDMPKIGKFVEQHVIAIADFCEDHPDEFHRLQDDAYSKATFGVNYPFFRQPELLSGKYIGKYRKSPRVVINGETVLFTNDWYAKHYPAFIKYLQATGIIERELADAYLDSLVQTGSTSAGENAPKQDILKPLHIGNAQNLFVRNVLGRVRPDDQSYGGWAATWEFFDHCCAYCGTPLRKFDKDHVYSINYDGLGEHKRGNLVPACKPCNSAKSDQDFRTFLASKHADNPAEARARISKIEQFMADREYAPLPLDPRINASEVTALLLEARLQVEALASDYVERIQKLLAE